MKKRIILLWLYLSAAGVMMSCGDHASGDMGGKNAGEVTEKGTGTANGDQGSKEAETAYKEQCKTFDYKEYFRNDKKHIGEKIQVDIQVDQVIDGDFRGYDADGREYYVRDKRTGEDVFRIMEEDALTVYGDYSGVQQITRAIGSYDADIFCIEGRYIDLHEEGMSQEADDSGVDGSSDTDTEDMDAGDIFAMCAGTYQFSSGVGAWGTSMELYPDGSFSGHYSDSDMETGNGYDATEYQSVFHGRFKDAVAVNDYTYKMELDGDVVIDSGTGEYIKERVRYVNTDPYGMEVGREFRLYLPGAPVAQLPKAFVDWLYLRGEALSSYGIYNIAGGYGFVREETGDTGQSGVSWMDGNGYTDALSGGSEGYILPDSDKRYLAESELAGLDKATLRLARNEIYARHGRKFQTEDLNAYFSQQSWYHGYLSEEEFDASVLNGYEKANLALIRSVEDPSAGKGQQWAGTFVSSDGQTIVIDHVDDDGVTLTYQGYSEEGWYTKTSILSYINTEKTQVSDPEYYNGTLVQETVYTLTESGISVKVLPAGGWADNFYARQ